MSRVFTFLVLNLQASIHQSITCPSPYRDILGVCLHLGSSPMRWCQANEYCSTVEGELVRGHNFMPLNGKTFSGIPCRYWIGLTDLLEERRQNREGWRWTDGSLQPSSSNLAWNINNPSENGLEDCVSKCAYALGVKMCDVDCNSSEANPLCQQRPKPSSLRVNKYKEVSIHVGSNTADLAQGGCSTIRMGVNSKLRCALLCNNEHDDRCKSFYFNKEKKMCHLVLYTDARLNMVSGYKKLVKER